MDRWGSEVTRGVDRSNARRTTFHGFRRGLSMGSDARKRAVRFADIRRDRTVIYIIIRAAGITRN